MYIRRCVTCCVCDVCGGREVLCGVCSGEEGGVCVCCGEEGGVCVCVCVCVCACVVIEEYTISAMEACDCCRVHTVGLHQLLVCFKPHSPHRRTKVC